MKAILARHMIFAVSVAAAFAIHAPLAAADSTPGSLTQLTGANNCYAESGDVSECGSDSGVGMENDTAVVVSPDGKNVYVTSDGDSAVSEFARNADGSLSPLGGGNNCIGEAGSGSDCNNDTAVGLLDPQAIAISPDGKYVYVAASDHNAVGDIAEFARNADGSLTQLAAPNDCIAENEAQAGHVSDCGTQTAHGIQSPSSLAVSPDGDNVYAGDYAGQAVAEFTRAGDGSLGQGAGAGDCIAQSGSGGTDCNSFGPGLGSVGSVIVSPDGSSVYTAGFDNSFDVAELAEFARGAGGGLTQLSGADNCIEAKGVSDGCGSVALGFTEFMGLAISPDGQNVYGASEFGGGPIAEFSRDASGGLRQLPAPNNCISEQGQDPGGCGTQAAGINTGDELAVSPDGASVYAPADTTNCSNSNCQDVAEFARNADGSLTQLPSPDNCIQDQLRGGTECGNESGAGLGGDAVAVAPDSSSVYVLGIDDIAEFAHTAVTHTLTVALGGTGSGSVSDGTGAVSCPSTCAHAYTAGTVLTLTATPAAGAAFAGWSGAGCSGTATCTVRMAADTAITATFKNGAPLAAGTTPTIQSSSAAGFSGVANSNGSATYAFFQYGLDQRYLQPGSSGPDYTSSTPSQLVGSDAGNHTVTASVSGLVPNALYHVRLVAFNAYGTVYGPDQTFTTPAAPPPPPPVLGQSFNAAPVSGTVYLLLNGALIPITENTKIPVGSLLDTLHGTIVLHTSTGSGTFTGAVFKLSQIKFGPNKGLSTLTLWEGTHNGAPAYSSCKAKGAADAHSARLSSRILQTLKSKTSGRFRTRGRYASATVLGTQWTSTDRCDGTLISVQIHAVLVLNLFTHKTFLIKAGHHYLAHAP